MHESMCQKKNPICALCTRDFNGVRLWTPERVLCPTGVMTAAREECCVLAGRMSLDARTAFELAKGASKHGSYAPFRREYVQQMLDLRKRVRITNEGTVHGRGIVARRFLPMGETICDPAVIFEAKSPATSNCIEVGRGSFSTEGTTWYSSTRYLNEARNEVVPNVRWSVCQAPGSLGSVPRKKLVWRITRDVPVGDELLVHYTPQVLNGRSTKLRRARGGFVRKHRQDVRDERGRLFTEKCGNRTCLEDAVANAAFDVLRQFDTELDMDALYGLWDPTEDTPFLALEPYFGEKGLQLKRCTSDFLLGGPAAVNLLQCDDGLFIVQLALTYDNQDCDPDMHCVYYNAKQGYIIDNDRHSKPLYLERRDREFSSPPTALEKRRAYALWQAVSPSFAALKVRVFNVYHIAKHSA